MQRPVLTALVALLLAIALVACGGDDQGETTSPPADTTATDGSATPGAPGEVRETADRPAELPPGWSTDVNRSAGFSIGVPPDWTIRPAGGGLGSVLSSPDELITISVTADRSQGALGLPLEEFATRTMEALGSDVVGEARIEGLQVQRAAPFNHDYEAAAVRAVGRSAKTGVFERIIVIVVRRPEQAAYVIVARENGETPSQFADRQTVKEIVRTLRGRPPA